MLTNHAICIGAQKAGTTWLFRCLQEHPSICVFEGKEMHFFSNHYNGKKLGSYERSFCHCNRDLVTFEASTSYLSDPNAAKRIKLHYPNAKLILIVRDPVERTFSHILHYQSRGWLTETDVSKAIEQFPELIENSMYGKHLESYLSCFAANAICLVDYSEICNDPQKVIDKVCDFMDISRFQPSALSKQYHSTQARSHPLYFPISRTYHRLKKNSMGRTAISLLRKMGINNLLIDSVLKKTAQSKGALTKNDRSILQNYFAEDMEKFAKIRREHFPYTSHQVSQ